MDKMTHYHMAFKQGGIYEEDADEYINSLEEDTLDMITKLNFDRSLLKPIMEVAAREIEENENLGFNQAVSNILRNKRRMLSFMQHYCLCK